jgi:trehalose 6-phosphate synthase/phosphatase
MSRLLTISNRLPFNIIRKKDAIRFQKSIGGLATGLGSFYKSNQSFWIGWPGIALEEINQKELEKIKKRLGSKNCYPVFLSRNDISNYYQGFCNKTIWPLFSYFPQYTIYEEKFWKSYKDVNEAFCDAVIQVLKKDDIIWVHDYQLMLLPRLLREKLPDATIGFFLHIPFPSSELFRLLPWREEIIEGLLGADLIGFHTYDYVRHFLNSLRFISGYDSTFGQINIGNRIIKADVFPMGIDYNRFASATKNPKVQKEIRKFKRKLGDRKIILSMDRLDYTKGLSQRLKSFDYFLTENPEFKEKASLILVASPSRLDVDQYKLMKKEIDEIVGRINGKYGTMGWVPIWYINRYLDDDSVSALYSIADVALVTPLRDGMNLISKEFIATKTNGLGVLILSGMAGAAKELGEAIIVNPNNIESIASALVDALKMSKSEQIARNRTMQKRLRRYNIERWAKDFIEGLDSIKKTQRELTSKRLTSNSMKQIVDDYKRSKNRLVLLDYDGTLVSFTSKPTKIKPDKELSGLLKGLISEPNNEVIIVSGRDKNSLGKGFKKFDINLIAEHGVWIKCKKNSWEIIEPLRDDWKEEIHPLLELYVDRTPGSIIEEKDYSLVWHYRKADPELASVRARELRDDLLHLTTNLDVGVLEGSKVIEVKNLNANKGQAATRFISKKKWDFILAIGDDQTDEDVFATLPDTAYSIKVRLGPSQAKYTIESPEDVRHLLKELIS